jgi:hypothetical protein
MAYRDMVVILAAGPRSESGPQRRSAGGRQP